MQKIEKTIRLKDLIESLERILKNVKSNLEKISYIDYHEMLWGQKILLELFIDSYKKIREENYTIPYSDSFMLAKFEIDKAELKKGDLNAQS